MRDKKGNGASIYISNVIIIANEDNYYKPKKMKPKISRLPGFILLGLHWSRWRLCSSLVAPSLKGKRHITSIVL